MEKYIGVTSDFNIFKVFSEFGEVFSCQKMSLNVKVFSFLKKSSISNSVFFLGFRQLVHSKVYARSTTSNGIGKHAPSF